MWGMNWMLSAIKVVRGFIGEVLGLSHRSNTIQNASVIERIGVHDASSPAGKIFSVALSDALTVIDDENQNVTVGGSSPLAIDASEQIIRSGFATQWAGLAHNTVWDTDVIVTSVTAMQAALINAVSNPSKKTRITCDWDGPSSKGSAVTLANTKLATTSWYDHGGGVFIVAAASKKPAIADAVNCYGLRGVHWKGIRFSAQYNSASTASARSQYAFTVQTNTTYPPYTIMRWTECVWGSGNEDSTTWISAFKTNPGVADDLCFEYCLVKGVQNGFVAEAKIVRFRNNDFQQCLSDCIDVFGHTSQSGYYAYVWADQNTFRNAGDELDNRNNHMDSMQSGTALDIHLGYRILTTDNIVHLNHSYAGDPGLGGATQGFYNDDYLNADNLFVTRRNIILTASPHGFTFFSPKATNASYMDSCTLNRTGRVPSGFTGDVNPPQDFAIGIMLNTAGGGWPQDGQTWFTITNSASGKTVTTELLGIDAAGVTVVDPRIGQSVGPEDVFVGRDFTRGGAAANFVAGKFGYDMPNEAGTQAEFVADVWANWAPLPAYAGQFAPDPTGLVWAATTV